MNWEFMKLLLTMLFGLAAIAVFIALMDVVVDYVVDMLGRLYVHIRTKFTNE